MISYAVCALSCIGIVVCLYGLLIEQKIKRDIQYRPLCELSASISCLKPMMSAYGKFFGISNFFWGLFYYSSVLILAMAEQYTLLCNVVLLGIILTIAYAFILYVKLRTLCILCTIAYALNIALVIASYNYCY